MKNQHRSFFYLLVLVFLSNISLYGSNRVGVFESISEAFAPSPPAVISPLYYCQNSSAPQLSATASSGATLIWYGTSITGGVPSAIAPTPSTTVVGQTKYYVSQVDVTGESARAEIVVNVVRDSGATIPDSFFCRVLGAADGTRSVEFDWGNHPLTPGATFYYEYVITGGLTGTGSTTNANTNATVSGVWPGQSVTLTITSLLQYPCVPALSRTCTVPCVSFTTPTFASVPTSYCINEVTTNLPTSSDDSPAITGTWSPAKVNTATAGTTNYAFTPDPVLFPCALTRTLAMTVGPVEPSFTDFSICSGVVPVPVLSPTSPNGISGSWSPASVDDTTSGAYVFTPFPGQACAPTAKTINVTVNPSNTILSMGWTVSEAFADNQIVTVTDPLGANYLYQLDDGPFQEETVFEMVSLGMHSITVKDVNGCSVLRNDNVLVIDYPRFFTPNNDGFNDYWNVFTLVDKLGSKIHIFDRYGKLIKEISPNGTGWNGTYNGRPLPATDYWFVVDYPEDGIIKKFRSHFSLKR